MNALANIILDMQRPAHTVVYAVQNDKLTRKITAQLVNAGIPWTVPTGALMMIRYSKPDGTTGFYDTDEAGATAYTISGSTVTFTMVQQALAVAGNVAVQLSFYTAGGDQLSTFAFVITVQPSVYNDAEIISSDYFNVLAGTIGEIAAEIQQFETALAAGYGAPLVASTVAGMTDHAKIYVYTGSESGYVSGNWYYWNGTAWTSGGVYNAVAVDLDATLTSATKPAQAKAVGDAVDNLKSEITTLANLPTENLVSPSEINVSSGSTVTYELGEDGSITITNTGNSTYACVQTENTWGKRLIKGTTYRLYAEAEKISGSPVMMAVIRGVEGNANGIKAIIDLSDGMGCVDFVADEYVQRVTLFISLSTATRNSSVKYKNIFVKALNENIDTRGAVYEITVDDLEQGSFSGSGKSTSANRIRLNTPFFTPKGTRFKGNCAPLYYQVFELSSNSTDGGNLLISSQWIYGDSEYCVSQDCWSMLSFANNIVTTQATSLSDFTGKNVVVGGDATYHELRTKTYTSENLTSGGFASATGANTDAKKIRMISPQFCAKGTRIKISAGALYCMIWELSSDYISGGNTIASYTWAQRTEHIVENDCYVMMAFATASSASAQTNITPADFDGYYQFLDGNSRTAVMANYYGAGDTEQESQTLLYNSRVLSAGNSIESFLFFTDLHVLGGENWEYRTIEAVGKMASVYNTSPVDFCLNGGDSMTRDSNYDASITKASAVYYLSYFDKLCSVQFGKDYLPMVGNHDYNYNSDGNQLTDADIVKAMFRRWGKDYYKYNGCTSTVYVLNSGMNQTSGGSANVPMDEHKWEQLDWLANDLHSNDDVHNIVCMHIIRNNNSTQPEFVFFTNINDVCAAYNNHETITKNGITYDFTNCTGRVEMILGGHLHTDEVFDIFKNGIPCIMRCSAGLMSVYPSFDLVLCDWVNRTVIFQRIGSGNSLSVNLDTGVETVIT